MVKDKPNFNYNYSHIPNLKEENNCYLLEIDYDLLPKNNWSLSVDLEYPVFSPNFLSHSFLLILHDTIPGFLSRGLSLEEGESLLKKSVKLAAEARNKFWDGVRCVPGNSYNRALVAASIGSYGAYLADGSE
ncbi:hypothetical protein J1N35_007735 [Gossypium stocksii]|uniref:Hcy-binding domain-containing protein n=1 Tax=Gossypium stocksii TaxID=47602 RepID=A0A9D4ADR2_9ROSI|nr:hypothetical protein J1N35_007735 [Gossypium stocksii]